MAKYQEKNNVLGFTMFRALFSDLKEEEQLNLAEALGKIKEVCKL